MRGCRSLAERALPPAAGLLSARQASCVSAIAQGDQSQFFGVSPPPARPAPPAHAERAAAMMMFIGSRVPPDDDNEDWDYPPLAGPSLSEADDQFIDLLVGDSDSDGDADEPVSAADVSRPEAPPSDARPDEDIEFSLGEVATDHFMMATGFLGRSVRRMSGSLTLYPSALATTGARASTLMSETVQQTRALSSTLLDLTVNRAMRLSSDAISVANEATRATLSSAGAALSPPRGVEHENGRVKHLPHALAERIAANAPDLSRLILHANEFTSFACSLSSEACGCFRSNTTLRDLYLYGWNIDDAGLAQILHCTSLRRLRLVENSVTDAGAEILIGSLFLRELDLSKGDWPISTATLSDQGAARLASLRYLTILRLNGHAIADRGAEALAAALPLLRVLGLSQNQISDPGASALVRLTALTYLDLSRNTVGAAGAHSLSRHPSLLLLNLAHNPIDDEALSHLLSSPRLAFLSAAHCTATAAALAHLDRAASLVALDLSNSNAMLSPALERLRRHPGLTFCDARQAHPDTALDAGYWQALHSLEDQVNVNLQTVLDRRRKIVLLFIQLARQRRASLLSNAPQTLPLDLLMVILGFASPADYGKTPLQLQSLCRWIFRNTQEVEARLRERRSLHVIERCYYNGVPESFRFAEQSSSSCLVS